LNPDPCVIVEPTGGVSCKGQALFQTLSERPDPNPFPFTHLLCACGRSLKAVTSKSAPIMFEGLAERHTPGGSASSSAGSSAAAPRHPPPIPDYELLRRIGHGSYGDVWLARSATGAFRAVKIVYRDTFGSSRPFEREFEGIRRFEPISRLHNSQVDILHVGRNDGCFYYVMELADDQTTGQQINAAQYSPRTLRSEIARRGSLPLEECLQIALALTMALENLHEHGLVHRDIKPSNIIFVNGVPKLADIGLVTQADATISFA